MGITDLATTSPVFSVKDTAPAWPCPRELKKRQVGYIGMVSIGLPGTGYACMNVINPTLLLNKAYRMKALPNSALQPLIKNGSHA